MKFYIKIITICFLLISTFTAQVFASSININLGMAATRISGDTRYETSYAIWKKYGDADTAFIVNGTSFPDALAVSPLAAKLNAPIILIDGKTISKTINDRLDSTGVTRVYIIGGAAAVSEACEKKLKERYSVIRLSGKDRYETCVAIARELCRYADPDEYYFTCASNYPDVLSVSSVAAIAYNPILYINKNGKLSDSVTDFINDRPVPRAVILGKYGAVGSQAEENLEKFYFTSIHRIGGDNRYETMLLINTVYNYLFENYAICMATGENFPDALSGAVLAAKYHAPIVLIPNNLSNNDKIVKYVKDYAPDMIYIFGGEQVISNKTLNAFSS